MSTTGTPARPRAVPKPRVRVAAGTMSYGQRPWPGIHEPHCYYCSWAYRGRWPFGRMEVKYANSACPVYAHSRPSSGGDDEATVASIPAT